MILINLTTKNRQTGERNIFDFGLSAAAFLIKTSLGILICFLALTNAFGQNVQYTDNTADQSLRGSGRVNPSTLAMEFSLPLGNYPGRGINMPINLSYSSKVWRLDYITHEPEQGSGCHSLVQPVYAENSASGWTTSLSVPYIEYTGTQQAFNNDGQVYYADTDIACDPGNPNNPTIYYIRRVTLHLPGGETHELRMSDTHVQQSSTWNGTYYAVDGSNIRYVQDSANNIYRALMPDGSFYDFNYASGWADKVSKFTDRNGNYITYHAPNTTYPNGYWTDTLGKEIPLPITPQAPGSPTSDQSPQVYSLPGMTGTYKLHWKQLKGASAAESGLTTFSDSLKYWDDLDCSGFTCATRTSGTYLFGSDELNWVSGPDAYFNPIVLTAIELPNGEKYKFTYNVYGEIERIYYPTGAEERFEHDPVGSVAHLTFPYSQASRGVTNRKVYETAGAGTPSEWEYEAIAGVIKITNPDDTLNVRYLHTGYEETYFGFDNALAGMPYREFTFSSTGVLQAQKITYWTQSTNGRHPRVVRGEDLIYISSGSGLSSTAIYEFEGDLSYKETPVLVNRTTAYAFETASGGNSITPTNLPSTTPPTLPTSTPSTPVKITEATYLINDTNYSSTVRDNYKNQNMVGLVTISKILDGSGTNVVAKSETIYDESSTYPILTYTSNPSQWQDPNTNYRGNPTTVRSWKDITNNQYITVHAQFDSFGNQRKIWDALSNVTETAYSSTYGYAFPTQVTTAAPDQNGGTYGSTSGFTTSATYNQTTGLPLTTTDINNQTTTMSYDAATLRPTSVTAPNGQETQFVYGTPDSSGVYQAAQRFVKVRTEIDDVNWKEGYSWFDGLGRTIKSQTVDANGDVFSLTCYDQMGRVQKSSNPFKNVSNPTCSSSLEWTTPTYDDLGRPTVVTSPDSTTVQISYGISTSGAVGITKTVTDQAGRKRQGITDALGRMIRVIEDPDGDAFITNYVFDTLGNLRKTTQGDQNRYFMHDSLGRLLYAKQVEQAANSNFSGSSYTDSITSNNQWSVKYVYDDNGNITSTTDARNNTITGTYDHLNRLITRDYSDTSMADVSFYYDGTGLGSVPANSKGKTTKVASTVSETRYTGFDNMGRLTSSEQRTTPGQLAGTETPYGFSYTYNLSGALIEETYPSGRKVKNTLNADGELAQVQSKKNSNYGYFTYAMAFSYNAIGALEKMRYGNGHWETYTYNNRQQITQIGLGTTDSQTDYLKLEYAYGMWESGSLNTAKNNGSLARQIVTVPNSSGSSNAFTATQKYTYDALNRLDSSTETISSTETWKQTFTYDRYGNRRFDANNTTTLGTCTATICNPDISTSTNRLSSTGYTYDADGNLTQSANGNQFFYDSENRQTEVKNSSNQTIGLYYYDGEGKRVKKISSTETVIFVYDGGGKLVAEYSTALAQTQQVSYLTADHLGSARIITNENGAVTKRTDYGAFGDEISTSQRTNRTDYTTNDELREGYTGYEKDDESDLDYAQARYYNSGHGRFTSVDPLTASATIKDPQSFNRYSYVLNSPYKFTDPLGLLPMTSAGACGTWCRGGSYGGITEFDYMESSPGYKIWSNEAARGTDAGSGATAQDAAQPDPLPPDEIVQETKEQRAQYNCLAWALGLTDVWIAPTYSGEEHLAGYTIMRNRKPDGTGDPTYLPGGFNDLRDGKRYSMLGILKKFFGAVESVKVDGKEIEASLTSETPAGYYKIVVWEKGSLAHVMRQDADGTWSSKNGAKERVIGIKNPETYYNSFPDNARIKPVYLFRKIEDIGKLD